MIRQQHPIAVVVLGYEVDLHYQVLTRDLTIIPNVGCDLAHHIEQADIDSAFQNDNINLNG